MLPRPPNIFPPPSPAPPAFSCALSLLFLVRTTALCRFLPAPPPPPPPPPPPSPPGVMSSLRDFGVETLPCLQRGELCQDVFGDDRVEEGGALARDRVGDFEERKSMPRLAILVCMFYFVSVCAGTWVGHCVCVFLSCVYVISPMCQTPNPAPAAYLSQRPACRGRTECRRPDVILRTTVYY